MQHIFLTSSPFGPLDNSYSVRGVDPANGLPDLLKARWKEGARVLIISAFPADIPANIEMRRGMENAMREEGLSVSDVHIWDDRMSHYSEQDLLSYDVIYLGGGHVPTENAYFKRIGLDRMILKFDGIIIGISAGSMNAASFVYAQPELPGESLDPAYQRFLSGLGLTGLQILPHYQMVRKLELDGRRIIGDITMEDSFGHEFLALPDGSFVLCEDGRETVYGEAFRIADGRIGRICRDGESLILSNGTAPF